MADGMTCRYIQPVINVSANMDSYIVFKSKYVRTKGLDYTDSLHFHPVVLFNLHSDSSCVHVMIGLTCIATLCFAVPKQLSFSKYRFAEGNLF